MSRSHVKWYEKWNWVTKIINGAISGQRIGQSGSNDQPSNHILFRMLSFESTGKKRWYEKFVVDKSFNTYFLFSKRKPSVSLASDWTLNIQMQTWILYPRIHPKPRVSKRGNLIFYHFLSCSRCHRCRSQWHFHSAPHIHATSSFLSVRRMKVEPKRNMSTSF